MEPVVWILGFKQWDFGQTMGANLLAPHGTLAVIAFRYYYSTTLPSPPIFSKYSPQTSQNQCLEEASIGLCVGATP